MFPLFSAKFPWGGITSYPNLYPAGNLGASTASPALLSAGGPWCAGVQYSVYDFVVIKWERQFHTWMEGVPLSLWARTCPCVNLGL